MSNRQDNNELIEKYLLNQMSEEEKAEVQFKILMDEDFRREVETLRTVQKTLVAEKQKSGFGFWKRSWKRFLSLLVIVVGIGAAFIFLQKNTPESKNNNTPANVSAEKETTDSSTEEFKTNVPEVEKKEEEQTPVEDTKLNNPVNPKPIAQVDPKRMIPNEYLEEFTQGVRNSDISTELKNWESDKIFKWKDGKTTIDIQGTLSGSNLPKVRLSIYDNRSESFENGTTVLSKSMELKNESDFSFLATLEIPQGLYYFLLENEETEDVLIVRKFVVK